MIETPLLGEGGIKEIPDLLFKRFKRAMCNKKNILLILDEVQSWYWKNR